MGLSETKGYTFECDECGTQTTTDDPSKPSDWAVVSVQLPGEGAVVEYLCPDDHNKIGKHARDALKKLKAARKAKADALAEAKKADAES